MHAQIDIALVFRRRLTVRVCCDSGVDIPGLWSSLSFPVAAVALLLGRGRAPPVVDDTRAALSLPATGPHTTLVSHAPSR